MRARTVTRRQTLLAPTAAIPAVALLPAQGSAATPLSAVEKANLDTVLEFIALWGEPATTAAGLAAFLTDDCVIVTNESRPTALGRAAAEAMFADYLARGRIRMEVLGSYAFGPAVLVGKLDTFIRGGTAGATSPFAGVFVLRDGRIRHWTEYAGPRAA